MFKVQYYLSNGEEIDYHCANDTPQCYDLDAIAMMVAKARPNRLPDTIFVSARIYRDFTNGIGMMMIYNVATNGPTNLCFNSAAGPLIIRPMPMCCDAKLFLVGCQDDYDRYDIDRVFDEVVIQGKEDKDESTLHRGSAPQNQSV